MKTLASFSGALKRTSALHRICLAAPLAGRFAPAGTLLATETKRPASGAAKHAIANPGVISIPFLFAVPIVLIIALLALPASSKPAAAPVVPASGGISPLGPNETAGKIPVLLVKGMWSQHWNLDDALATPKGMYGVSSSYVTQGYNYVFALKYFPLKKKS